MYRSTKSDIRFLKVTLCKCECVLYYMCMGVFMHVCAAQLMSKTCSILRIIYSQGRRHEDNAAQESWEGARDKAGEGSWRFQALNQVYLNHAFRFLLSFALFTTQFFSTTTALQILYFLNDNKRSVYTAGVIISKGCLSFAWVRIYTYLFSEMFLC